MVRSWPAKSWILRGKPWSEMQLQSLPGHRCGLTIITKEFHVFHSRNHRCRLHRRIACARLEARNDKLGLIMTTVLGIAGSLLARYVGVAMGWYGPNASVGWIASIIGAIVLLVIYGLVKKKA
jgi:uncharacterized membrane protein YeaQ/YmgE (transglycosylase-associated protein family)